MVQSSCIVRAYDDKITGYDFTVHCEISGALGLGLATTSGKAQDSQIDNNAMCKLSLVGIH